MDYRCTRMAGLLGVLLGVLAPVDALPLRSLLLARSPAPARGVGGAAAVSSTANQTDSQSFTDNTGRLVGIAIGAFVLIVIITLSIFTYRNKKAKKRRLKMAAMQSGQTTTSRFSSEYVAAARPENAKLMDGKYDSDMTQVYYSGPGGRGAVDTQYKGSYVKP